MEDAYKIEVEVNIGEVRRIVCSRVITREMLANRPEVCAKLILHHSEGRLQSFIESLIDGEVV